MNSSISNECLTLYVAGITLYVAGFSRFYRYTLQGLPLYVAGITVIRCRVSPEKIHEGDTYETLMRIIRESHETFRLRRPALRRGV